MRKILLVQLITGLIIWSCSNSDKGLKINPHVEQTNSIKVKSMTKSDWKNFDELLEQNIALSFEKQLFFGEIIGSRSWQFDMNSGTITFGDNLSYPVQIIGSLSFIDNSWMWGWANSESNIPERLLKQSNQLKKIGESKQINELTKDIFTVDQGFEHKIGMIACGLFNSKSYYCANYGDGTLVVTIASDKIPGIDLDDYTKILSTFPQLLNSFDFNHRSAFINYLIDRDFEVKMEGNFVKGDRDGKLIIGEFDNQLRLINLEGKN